MIIDAPFLPTTDAAADRTIGPLNVGDYGNYWFGVTFSGADVVGSLQIQVAATKDFARPFNVGTATAVTASAEAQFSGDGISYPYVRLVWDYTSGTGDITVDACMRQPRLWGGG